MEKNFDLKMSEHFMADGRLTENAKALIVARMRVKIRETLRDIRLGVGDKLTVEYVLKVTE